MNQTTCAFDIETLHAVRSGRWSDTLRSHTATCAVCQQTRVAAEAVHSLRSQANDVAHPFPSHQLLWIRAQFARREDKLSALDVFTLAGVIVLGALGFIGFVFWRWPQVKQVFGNATAVTAPRLVDVFPVGAPLFVLLAVVGLILLMTNDYSTPER